MAGYKPLTGGLQTLNWRATLAFNDFLLTLTHLTVGKKSSDSEWKSTHDQFITDLPGDLILSLGLSKSLEELKTHKDLDGIDDREDLHSGESRDILNLIKGSEADDTDFKVMDGGLPYTCKTEEDIKDFFSGDLTFV